MQAGFDFGSKNLHAAVLDGDRLVETYTVTHHGNRQKAFSALLKEIEAKYGRPERFGVTGSVELDHFPTIDTAIAAVEANRFLKTGARHILGIGCETFYLIFLDERGNYTEHSVNPLCASGTGSFLDQQAERIAVTTEELARRAEAFSGKTPSIATRCAVFAKSDITHAQAEGFTKDAIAAGLCEGMATGVLANLLKGRELSGEVLLVGGVSQNAKMVLEIEKRIDARAKPHREAVAFHAIGAAVLADQTDLKMDAVLGSMAQNRQRREPLVMRLTDYPDFSADPTWIDEGVEITEYATLDRPCHNVFIGIDIGSTSTKALVLDEGGTILAGFYTRTAGEPVAVARKLLEKITRFFEKVELFIRGVGTTGSGRKLVHAVFDADLQVNEITAHARGATFLDPKVDTIIEIGGQDSKFTLLRDGEVVSSTMNYVCAAGTGSFIEEQAARLEIELAEIESRAIGSRAPFTSDRCTVYMERDLNLYLSEGFTRDEIITAVLFSVRDNYLSKVVGKTALGKHLFFQGATARNKALVAAFENEIGCPVSVSKYCHLTGALGVAVLLRESGIEKSKFAGLDLTVEVTHETCELCRNRCSLTVYETAHGKTAWGLKCGRDYEAKRVRRESQESSLERRFEAIFQGDVPSRSLEPQRRLKIGIPCVVYLAEYYPWFEAFFRELGHEVVLEKPDAQHMNEGKRIVNSDFCTPMVLAHGVVASLVRRGVDLVFLPAMINEQSLLEHYSAPETFLEKRRDAYFCYYSEYLATIVSHLTAVGLHDRILSPMIQLNHRTAETVADSLADDLVASLPNDREEIRRAFLRTLAWFRAREAQWREAARPGLESPRDQPSILFLGRPYTVFDPHVNLGIPAKFESMGFDIFYQSMLEPCPEMCPFAQRFLPKMHWFYGQQLLLAAETAARSEHLFPVFLSSFRCSPDSYLLTYTKEIFAHYQKPSLVIQLDEHTSDVGYQTRMEAAIEAFQSAFRRRLTEKNAEKAAVAPKASHKTPTKAVSIPVVEKNRAGRNDPVRKGDLILLPFLSELLSPLQAEALRAHGHEVRVVPHSERDTNRGYRYASGAECMPNVAIVGSVLGMIERESLDLTRTIVSLPTLCLGCNFNQYTIFLENALAKSGLDQVRIYNGSLTAKINGLSYAANKDLFGVNVLGSIVYKLYFRAAPYERRPGEAWAAREESVEWIKTGLKRGHSLFGAAQKIHDRFAGLDIDRSIRKPRIAISGDFYAKYNERFNQNIFQTILELGGEVLIPGYSEFFAHMFACDEVQNGLSSKYLNAITHYERKFERIFQDLLPDELEPSVEACHAMLAKYEIEPLIAGETSMNIARVLYGIEHRLFDAVVHLNPVFCCPGVVSSSIFRDIQKKTGVPILDLFYDGKNRSNQPLIPQLHALRNRQAPVSQ